MMTLTPLRIFVYGPMILIAWTTSCAYCGKDVPYRVRWN